MFWWLYALGLAAGAVFCLLVLNPVLNRIRRSQAADALALPSPKS